MTAPAWLDVDLADPDLLAAEAEHWAAVAQYRQAVGARYVPHVHAAAHDRLRGALDRLVELHGDGGRQ